MVHGDKELLEKLGRMIHARVVRAVDFKNCCMRTGHYDGRNETTKTDRNGYGSMSYPVPNIPITDHLLSNSELV